MRIETLDNKKATARVVLTGYLDVAGADLVALRLAALAGAKQGLIIDMSGVSFIDPNGIRHLAAAAEALSRRNGGLVLLNPSLLVAEVLKASGLTDLLPVVRSESEALSVLSRTRRARRHGGRQRRKVL
jgi:anti-sigma B factor antagonist